MAVSFFFEPAIVSKVASLITTWSHRPAVLYYGWKLKIKFLAALRNFVLLQNQMYKKKTAHGLLPPSLFGKMHLYPATSVHFKLNTDWLLFKCIFDSVHHAGHICGLSLWATYWTEGSSSTQIWNTGVEISWIGVYTTSLVDSLSLCPFQSLHSGEPSHNRWWSHCCFFPLNVDVTRNTFSSLLI